MNDFDGGGFSLSIKKGCCTLHYEFDLNIFGHTVKYFGIVKMLFDIFEDMFDLRSV
jgi:hypothetical protein